MPLKPKKIPMRMCVGCREMKPKAELMRVVKPQEGDPAIDAMVLQRAQAKKAKNFAEADRIRDELKAQGIEITDVLGGAVWKRV